MNNDNLSVNIKPKLISDAWVWLSVLVSVLVITTSLLGILNEKTYSLETTAWAIQAKGQDYANLIVVIILLVSTYFVTKNSLKGYVVWLGAFMYVAYAFAIYAFALHFQFLFLAYVLILGLSFYALVYGFMIMGKGKIPKAILENSRAKIVSGLLMVIGIMFSFLWLSEIIPNIVAGSVPQSLIETKLLVNPIHVLDLAFLFPAMITTSILLWRKKIWGYILAVPLLIFSVTMGLGIIAIFIISAIQGQPYSLVPGIAISSIIILSAYFSYLFLKEIPEVEK